MAQAPSVYDPDSDKQPSRTPSDDELRETTGIDSSEEGVIDRDALEEAETTGGLYNDEDDEDESLGDRETAAESGTLYNPSDDGKQTIRQKFGGGAARLLKNKWLLGLVGGGGALILVAVLFVMILLGALKLPNVMNHIVGYEFARLSRQFAQRATVISEESLAMQAADDGALAKLRAKYTSGYTNVRGSTWGKLDKYRPNKVMQNLGTSDNLKLKFKTSPVSGRQIFIGAELGGVKYDVKPVTGAVKFVPVLSQLIETKNQANFSREFSPALKQALKATDSGPIIRGATARLIRQQIGINLVAWNLSRFGKEKTPNAALLEQTRQTAAATEKATNKPNNATTSLIREGVDEARAAEAATLADDKLLDEAVKDGGFSKEVGNAITKSTTSSLVDEGLKIANPIYAIAVPVCIVFDGSVQQSGPTIDTQVDQQQAMFYYFASAADQQKAGVQKAGDAKALSSAVGATNEQLGDITKTNPEILARGGTVNTSSEVTAQAGASGSYDYSILNALGIVDAGSLEGKVVNQITENGCAVLTDLRVAGGVAVANITAAILTFGGTAAAEEGVGITARAVVGKFITTSINKAFTRQVVKKGITEIERGALNRGLRFAFKQGLIVGGTYGATELANLVVASRAAQVNSGLASGADAVHAAQSGANIHAGELERQQLFGRPLTKDEVGLSDRHDKSYIASLNQTKSFSNRYFAVTNPDSLVSHMGTSLQASMSTNLLTSVLRLTSALFRPLSYVGSLFTSTGIVYAAPDPSTQHYGNVQFGWSEAEEELINTNATFRPLENQRILDASGQEGSIAADFAFCFGYTYNAAGTGSFDPSDEDSKLQRDTESTLGKLLSDGKIDRDGNGNVVTSGAQCSPNKLGVDNPTYGDLVLRWRLALSYLTTVEQLSGIQNVKSY